jgi:hypothetical protein
MPTQKKMEQFNKGNGAAFSFRVQIPLDLFQGPGYGWWGYGGPTPSMGWFKGDPGWKLHWFDRIIIMSPKKMGHRVKTRFSDRPKLHIYHSMSLLNPMKSNDNSLPSPKST